MAKVKKNSKLQFSKGDYVVYPSYGPGRILAIKKVEGEILENDIIKYGDKEIGKIMISEPYPFALIKVVDPDLEEFINTELVCQKSKVKITKPKFLLDEKKYSLFFL